MYEKSQNELKLLICFSVQHLDVLVKCFHYTVPSDKILYNLRIHFEYFAEETLHICKKTKIS